MIEATFLLVIVSIIAVGVGVGLQALAGNSAANDQERAISAEIISELEVKRTTTFATLAAAAKGSGTTTIDTVAIKMQGRTKTFPRQVTITQWDPADPDKDTSPQADFLSLQITIGGRTATVWVTQP